MKGIVNFQFKKFAHHRNPQTKWSLLSTLLLSILLLLLHSTAFGAVENYQALQSLHMRSSLRLLLLPWLHYCTYTWEMGSLIVTNVNRAIKFMVCVAAIVVGIGIERHKMG